MQKMIYGMLTAALLLTGCAIPSTDAPAWMVNPHTKYPQDRFLVALGAGDTRRDAETRAAAGLSRIFESRIQAEESLSETTTETRGSKERFDQFSELRANIQVGSEQDLLNIQFGDAFTDLNGRVHIAAYIPRAETADIYRSRIAENDRAIIQLIHQSNAATGPLEIYALRRAAVRNAIENERLLAQLDIILPGIRKRIALSYDPQTLYSETATAAQNVTFSVELSGMGGDALREALTGMGFSEGLNAVLRITGSATVDKTDLRRESLVFVRTHYRFDIRNGDGMQILSLNGEGREGHINVEQATVRAQRSLRRDILDQAPKEIGRFLDRLASAE